MKNKILTFIIGVLVGAIITTVGFLIYNKTIGNNQNVPNIMRMNENGPMGEPPEKPTGEDSEVPPQKPNELNNNVNT